MSSVTWHDDSVRIRLFQTALRVSTHFYDAINNNVVGDDETLLHHIEELNHHWSSLARGKEHETDEYPPLMQDELFPLRRQPIFDYIRIELGKPFARDQRLWQVNQKALDGMRECIHAWGGKKAKKRVKQLALLPLHCETAGKDETESFFERAQSRILIRVGSPEIILLECLVLEFTLFHEYLSHAFPTWSKDVEEISEGFLFALEFEWLQSKYTLFDNDLMHKLWDSRLEKDRDSFRIGQWLLRRCDSFECVRRFFLEWVAGWTDFPQSDHLDLLSQLKGIYNKIGSRFGQPTAKSLELLKALDLALCEPCHAGNWNVKKMKDLLGTALDAYKK